LLKFQAVQEYYRHLIVRRAVGFEPAADLFVKASGFSAVSRDLIKFDDNSVVVVTEQDLEGYSPSCQSETMTSEIWADLNVVYRVRVAGQAALARISCLWLRYGADQKISAEKLSRESSCSIRTNHLGGISVDIHVY
jgi:atypical dual specificity phosphatase